LLNIQVFQTSNSLKVNFGFSNAFSKTERVTDGEGCDEGGNRERGGTSNCVQDDTNAITDDVSKWINRDKIVSFITMFVMSIVVAWILIRCRSTQNMCGWGTVLAAGGAISYLSAEIQAYINYQEIESDIKYRADIVAQNADNCGESDDDSDGGDTTNEDGEEAGTLGDQTACDQVDAIRGQLEAVTAAKEVAKTSMWLKYAAAAIFTVSMGYEFYQTTRIGYKLGMFIKSIFNLKTVIERTKAKVELMTVNTRAKNEELRLECELYYTYPPEFDKIYSKWQASNSPSANSSMLKEEVHASLFALNTKITAEVQSHNYAGAVFKRDYDRLSYCHETAVDPLSIDICTNTLFKDKGSTAVDRLFCNEAKIKCEANIKLVEVPNKVGLEICSKAIDLSLKEADKLYKEIYTIKKTISVEQRNKIVGSLDAAVALLVKGGCVDKNYPFFKPSDFITPLKAKAVEEKLKTDNLKIVTDKIAAAELNKPNKYLASISAMYTLEEHVENNVKVPLKKVWDDPVTGLGKGLYYDNMSVPFSYSTIQFCGFDNKFNKIAKEHEAKLIEGNLLLGMCITASGCYSINTFELCAPKIFPNQDTPFSLSDKLGSSLQSIGTAAAKKSDALFGTSFMAPNQTVFNYCSLMSATLPPIIPVNYGTIQFQRAAVNLPDTKYLLVGNDINEDFWNTLYSLRVAIAENIAAGSKSDETAGSNSMLNNPPVDNSNFSIRKLFASLGSLIVPKTKAGSMTEGTSDHWGMGMFAALGLGIIIGLIIFLTDEVDILVPTPVTRAILFSVMAALALASAIIAHVQVDELEAAEESLQKILEATDVVAVSAVGMDAAGGGASSVVDFNFDDSKKDETTDLGNNGQPLMCQCGGDGKNGCKKCGKSIKVELAKVGFGTGTNSASSLVGETSDALSDGQLTSEELKTIASLGKNLAFIKKRVGKLKNMKSKRLQKLGFKNIDTDKEASIFAASIRSATQKAIASNPKGANELLSLAGDKKKGKEESKKKAIQALKKVASVSKAGSTKNHDPFSGMNFQLEEDLMDDDSLFDDEPDNSPTVSGDMYIPDNDIFSNPDASIFKMITTRYFKTAYPRFFDEDELIDSGKK